MSDESRPSIPPPDESEVAMDDARESTVLRAALTAHGVSTSATGEVEDGPARVLVADDDAATRELVANALREAGYEVDTVPDGASAVELVARLRYDIVVLDAVMPKQSGVDACRTIKGIRRDDFVSVLLLFTKTDAQSRIEALKIGADGYVCKPLEKTELLLCVSTALRVKRAHDRLAAAKAKLERLRSTDELTGACSFVRLHERLEEEFARAEKHAEPLACCIVDIDRLKVHNERGNRSFGDTVLRGVTDVVKTSIRDSDLVARYGGDELFVMLPATHFAGSLVVATRIWRDIAAKPFALPGKNGSPDDEVEVTASLGVALFPSRDVRTKDALLAALEAALLEAKRRGGNRLCVFQQQGFIYTPSAEDRG